jgi:hypothetical protein
VRLGVLALDSHGTVAERGRAADPVRATQAEVRHRGAGAVTP